MKRIFLVRHGNAYDQDWKQKSSSMLNTSGIKHAEALSLRFKDFKVTEAYSSTLERAQETSSIFMKYHPNVELVQRDVLREVFDFGRPTTRELEHFLKDKFEDTKREVYEHFKEIEKSSKEGNIFLFTHGNWIRLTILSVLGGNMDGFFSMSMEFSSVSCIEVCDEGNHKLLFYNDATHTKGLPYGVPWLNEL